VLSREFGERGLTLIDANDAFGSDTEADVLFGRRPAECGSAIRH
jgi:hypothetical protein